MQSLVNLRGTSVRASTPLTSALTPVTSSSVLTGSDWPTWLRSPRLLLQLLTLAIGVLLFSLGPVIPPVQAASSSVLRRGSSCSSVRQLQVNLTRVGVYNGPVSGYFGDQTEAAVRRYQATRGLRVDGMAGPATLTALNREVNGLVAVVPTPVPTTTVTTQAIVTTTPIVTPTPVAVPTPILAATLRRGDRGPAVAQLQRSLQAVGAYSGPITGYFGNLTEDAVIRYQRWRGLTVSGIAGPPTLTALANDLNIVAIGYPNTGAPTLVPVVTPGTQVVATTQVATTHYIATPGVTPRVVPTPIPVQPLPGPAIVPTGTGATWATTTPVSYGSVGGEVRAVQLQLRNLGFYQGPITGYFGPETQAAVYRYQQSRNIEPTGVIGPTTLSQLSREI